MHKTKTMLAVAILGLIAITGYSQTTTGTAATSGSATASPTPNPNAGTFQDSTLSIPQRIQLANTALTGTGIGNQSPTSAAVYMLSARPVSNLMSAFPNFAASVINDPTLGGVVTDTNQISSIYGNGLLFETATNTVLANQVAFLAAALKSPSPYLSPSTILGLKLQYAQKVASQAQAQYTSGDYAGAVTTAMPVIGYGNSGALKVVLQSKVALRSPDVLSWAKLIYEVEDFGHTQSGIDAVSSAYRAIDADVVRANAFIAYQTSGTGTNPMAGVALPSGITFIQNNAAAKALNYGLSGDNLDALKTAVASFANAAPGSALNSATAFVASWLRNTDGNLVRANAYVTAVSNGQPYTIAELSGTTGN